MIDDDVPDGVEAAVGPMLPLLLSAAEVARQFNRSERALRRWVKQGHLMPVRVGRSLFFRADDVAQLIAGHLETRILGPPGMPDEAP